MSGCQGCTFQGESTAVEDRFVGVRFGEETNLTICRTDSKSYAKGDRVMVELDSGLAHGRIEKVPMPIFKPCQKSSASRLLRIATEQDRSDYDRKCRNELSAQRYVRERVRVLGLRMKLSMIDFSIGSRSAHVYFTAERRVDFRQLVRGINRRFGVRVQMVQVGSRDEAKMLGGVGGCGRTLCCSSWMTDFRPISIQMAKRQNLSLNPSKISGQCGRLLCCLAYEDDQYTKGAKAPLVELGQNRG